MSKPKTIRTIAELQAALLLLIGGQGRAEGKKQIVETCTGNSRSTMTFYVGEIWWPLDADRGGPLLIHEIGDSPADAYRNCCLKLREELEERARLRKLERQTPAKAITHQPLRLTYQPTEAR